MRKHETFKRAKGMAYVSRSCPFLLVCFGSYRHVPDCRSVTAFAHVSSHDIEGNRSDMEGSVKEVTKLENTPLSDFNFHTEQCEKHADGSKIDKWIFQSASFMLRKNLSH